MTLAAHPATVHLVSISIDPEQDTPARLREYAERVRTLKGWDHYSGTVAQTWLLQKAFSKCASRRQDESPALAAVARGFRAEKPWVRLDGIHCVEDLLAERTKWGNR